MSRQHVSNSEVKFEKERNTVESEFIELYA
jgi:hypothetical protein